ncbi:hypothetical protein DXK91_06080 [Parageobacillus toebii]|nr:hypothetical protein CN643_11240 [Parageobacillus yumthangensis]PUF89500.1 hypothetical protein DCC82_11215 [Geobacillus sp. LYN3]RDV22813.1 hypothetical protein DXK91_06080 [Parageobacillus toebii]
MLAGGRFSMESGNPLLGKKTFLQGAAIMENGRRVWKTFIDVETDEERFVQIGKHFEKTHRLCWQCRMPPDETTGVGRFYVRLVKKE